VQNKLVHSVDNKLEAQDWEPYGPDSHRFDPTSDVWVENDDGSWDCYAPGAIRAQFCGPQCHVPAPVLNNIQAVDEAPFDPTLVLDGNEFLLPDAGQGSNQGHNVDFDFSGALAPQDPTFQQELWICLASSKASVFPKGSKSSHDGAETIDPSMTIESEDALDNIRRKAPPLRTETKFKMRRLDPLHHPYPIGRPPHSLDDSQGVFFQRTDGEGR
jgi:hypothetical protein